MIPPDAFTKSVEFSYTKVQDVVTNSSAAGSRNRVYGIGWTGHWGEPVSRTPVGPSSRTRSPLPQISDGIKGVQYTFNSPAGFADLK